MQSYLTSNKRRSSSLLGSKMKKTKSSLSINKELVCKEIMREVPGNHTKISKTRGGSVTELPSIKLQCPRPGCNKVIHFMKGKGYSNPFSHLTTCYGSENQVISLFNDAKKAQAVTNVDSSISSYFQA